ncbi:MAG TPA: MobF family relaxase [Opitutaceae bacterium]|nr:MobF family relaxase [Opitutaceae bacterium]
MLRPKPQLNLQNAREYFREHLCVGDYYSEGQKVTGEWLGEGARKLGLAGAVAERDFLALCEGRNPETGGRLTQRLNTMRSENGKLTANRRIFHDFTISPPKSVSIVALCYDKRIVDQHDRAVRVAMTELEKFAETRVRKSRQHGSRSTGNLVVAMFRHETARGELDPHLHTHCAAFNATHDAVEGRWKALQTEGMYKAQKFAENVYYHELCRGLRSLGYEIENNARDFEIRGVPQSVVACFSKRHAQIDAEAKRQAAQGYDGDMGELRTRIAHEHRARKMKNSTADELRSYWKSQLAAAEQAAMENLRQPGEKQVQTADVRAIVGWADEHVFARRSVVNDYELKALALARGRGENFDLADLSHAIKERDYFHPRYEVHKLSSRINAGCEGEIIRAVQTGMATRFAFRRDYQPDPELSKEQARAAAKILASKDFVTLFRGGAGTGKSHTLQEVARAIGAGEHPAPVLVLAPQRQQVQDLEAAGMPAQTLAHALTAKNFAPHSVVILDEAGQVGVRDMRELLRALQEVRGRLILSGDSRQHGAVSAGDALRWIEEHVPRKRTAELREIRRQNPGAARSAEEKRFIREYRAAVKEAAAGNIARSYDRLEKIGCVRELPDEPRRAAIAGEYLTALQRGERPLVVAQTWSEVHAANDAIRSALRSAGKVGDGKTLMTFQPVDRSEAQKRDARFYEAGQAVFFLKRYGRHAKGDVCEVAGASERGVVVVKDGRRSTVGYRYADRFAVVKRTDMEIAPGDRLQLKANGRSVEGARLFNGELVTVAHVGSTGELVVNDERGETKTLAPSQRLLVRGYAVTSYASQGKTADTVIVADAGNRAATSRQQWYVSISRGRKNVVVLTPDRTALRKNIQRSSERELALEEKRERVRAEREAIAWRARQRQFRELAIRHEWMMRQQEHQGIRQHL